MASQTPDDLLAAIRRLPLDERLRLIQRAAHEAEEDTPKPASVTSSQASASDRKLTIEEFLAARLSPPPGVGPVTLDDMERAIAEGASGRGSV